MVIKLYYYKKVKRKYKIFNVKSGELIASGTAEECASLMNYSSIHTFYGMVSKVESGQIKKCIVEYK